jgi:hypothetical protein
MLVGSRWQVLLIGKKQTSTLIPLLFTPTIYNIIEERGAGEKVIADELVAEGMPEPL